MGIENGQNEKKKRQNLTLKIPVEILLKKFKKNIFIFGHPLSYIKYKKTFIYFFVSIVISAIFMCVEFNTLGKYKKKKNHKFFFKCIKFNTLGINIILLCARVFSRISISI